MFVFNFFECHKNLICKMQKYKEWRKYKNRRNTVDYLKFSALRCNVKTHTELLCKQYVMTALNNVKSKPKSFWYFVNTQKITL